MNVLSTAIELATMYHEGQTRKGNSLPYVIHPIRVCGMLSEWGVTDAEVLAAAMLHDVLEDTEATADRLVIDVGVRVTSIVRELTKPEDVAKADYLLSFANRSPEALLIKVADRIDNVRDYLRTDPKYAKKYLEKAACLGDFMRRRYSEMSGTVGFPSTLALADWNLLHNDIPFSDECKHCGRKHMTVGRDGVCSLCSD